MPLSIFSVNLLSENLLLLASMLIIFAILITKVGMRFGVPSLLLFLILGMLAGKDGLGLSFDNKELAESIGHFAMTIILFTGGLETSLSDTKPVMRQGALLSTVGVLITVLLTAVFIHLTARGLVHGIGSSFLTCVMLASVMGSTDSASVFSILRGKKMHLRERLGPMLELESGSNDPMAYLLTIISVSLILSPHPVSGFFGTLWTGTWILVLQIVVGFVVGLGLGYGGKALIERVSLPNNSLYSILILSLAFFTNSVAGLLHGNGLLALYVASIVIGNKAEIPHKKDVLKFFDGMTWLMQLLMFMMLGLLARPSQMLSVAAPAIMIGLFMMLVARPASVFLCLLPFKDISFKAKAFVSWVGLKGAGPILFALYPVMAGVQGSSDIFNIVFFITLISLLVQGTTLSPAAKWLNLSFEEDPAVETFGIDIPDEMGMLRDHTVSEDDLAGGTTLRDLSLPHGIRVIMVRRGERYLVPHGSMELKVDDHLVIIMGESDDDLPDVPETDE
ncbi:MAG: potassium/proton antiporter [Bacteroidales bacterium]|nr:potassium/proton antiporter [Bacteroidales bacterium]